MLVNSHEVVVARYHYDPFGRKIAETGPLAAENAYQWSSKEHHSRSGLAYYLYRYYSPELQRWSNKDPLGDQATMVHFALVNRQEIPNLAHGRSMEKLANDLFDAFSRVNRNLYAAILNDPVNKVDLWGLIDCCECQALYKDLLRDEAALLKNGITQGVMEAILFTAGGAAIAATGGTAAMVIGAGVGIAGDIKSGLDAARDIAEARELARRASKMYARCLDVCE